MLRPDTPSSSPLRRPCPPASPALTLVPHTHPADASPAHLNDSPPSPVLHPGAHRVRHAPLSPVGGEGVLAAACVERANRGGVKLIKLDPFFSSNAPPHVALVYSAWLLLFAFFFFCKALRPE